MAKITMEDGMVIEGTAEELAQLAKTYGEGAESSVRVIEGDPQVGDKIRITRTVMAGSDYEIGDVLTVQYIYPDNDVRVEENRRLILRREFEIIGRNSDYPTTDERIDSLETRVTALEEGAEDSGEDEVTGGISESKYSPRDVVRGDSGNLYVLYCRCPENDYAGEGIAWRANESYFGWIGEDQIEKVSDEITSATPKVGDKVIVVKTIVSRGKYAIGDVLTVEEVVGDSGIHVKDIGVGLLSSEFKVVEIAPVAPAFEVGDYAKVVGRTFAGDLTTGSIVKITEEAGYDGHYRAELLDGSDYDHVPATSLEKLTEKEAKFAEIGRKVDEYKVGDIARVIHSPNASPNGTMVEVCSVDAGKVSAKGYSKNLEKVFEYFYDAEDLELITPVEHRFDK